MSNAFLLSVFAISASLGFICLFYAARVQSVMVRICNKNQSTIFLMAKIIVESPFYVLTVRFGGVVAWIIAVASYVGLMHRLGNGIR
jgi:hypothetical protein